MKKVFLSVILFLISFFVFSQSDELEKFTPLSEEEIARQTAIFDSARKLQQEKLVQLEYFDKALKNTVRFEKFIKESYELLDEFKYSYLQKDLEKTQRLEKEVRQLDFSIMEKQIESWEKFIQQSDIAYDKAKSEYDRIEQLILDNRDIMSDYDYKLFTGNIEYKNAPRFFKIYRESVENKAYEKIEENINNVKEISLKDLENAIIARVAEIKARNAEEKRIRSFIPGKIEEIKVLLEFYSVHLANPGNASPVKKELDSIKKIVDSTSDLAKADLNRLHELESDVNSVSFDYLENCLKLSIKANKALEALGIKLSYDKGWSNAKQQRYYIDIVKDSPADKMNVSGQLYFNIQKRPGANDNLPDFTDMSYTDFLINLGSNCGKSFSFVVNKKAGKIITIDVPVVE